MVERGVIGCRGGREGRGERKVGEEREGVGEGTVLT